MKNSQKDFAYIVLMLVIVSIVTIGGYFIFIKTSEPVTQQPTSTIMETLNPITTKKNETANWEVYRNDTYAIEFKHPAGWYVYNGIDYGTNLFIYERKVGPGLPGVNRLMGIYRAKNQTIDAKTYAEQNTVNYPSTISTDPNNPTNILLLKKEQGYVTIAQTQAYQVYTKTTDKTGPLECYNPPCDWSAYKDVETLKIGTFIPHKSAIFVVTAEMGGEAGANVQKKKINPQEEADYLNTYKLILSTIKFLN